MTRRKWGVLAALCGVSGLIAALLWRRYGQRHSLIQEVQVRASELQQTVDQWNERQRGPQIRKVK